MAIHAHSTPAPGIQPGLLRGGGTVPCRVLTSDELLAEIGRIIEGQEGFSHDGKNPPLPKIGEREIELPPEPLLACRGNTRTGIGLADRCSAAEYVTNYPDHIGVVEDRPDHFRLVDESRTLHLRRQLAQAAEHGAALLAALGLPQLVESGFSLRDNPIVVGDAVDLVIAALDALDGDTDLEDGGDAEWSLGWTAHVYQTPVALGPNTEDELDTADCEDDDPAEETSLETFGRGFVRCGADDAEEDDEPERDDESGSEDAEDIGHHASQFRPFPLTQAERAEVAVIAARAAAMRRVAHV